MTPARPIPVTGHTAPRFAPLQEVFARAVGAQRAGGAALSVWHHGEPVVDLVGGDYADDGLQLLFSVSKAVTAVAAAHAHAAGLLDLDAPLADSWPAFRRPATAAITVSQVLSHRSGIASFDATPTLDELLAGADTPAVEAQDPYWEPGTAHGYHGFTFGTLMTGVFRHVLGRTVGEYVSENFAPHGHDDLWLGVPPEVLPRIQRIIYEPAILTKGTLDHRERSSVPPSITARLSQDVDVYNDPRVALIGWPSSSGVASARALARLFAATLWPVDGNRLIDAAALARMTRTRSDGMDRALGFVTAFGEGVQRPFPVFPMLGPGSFGHEAAGGSAVAADPEVDLVVGWTTNVFPSSRGASPGFLALQSAIRHCATHDPS